MCVEPVGHQRKDFPVLTPKHLAASAALASLFGTFPLLDTALAQESAVAADAQTEQIVAAAEAFVATLSDAQRQAVQFAFTDATQRVNWSNFPLGGPGANRAGVKWGDLDQTQRDALIAMLGTVLSPDGVRMVQEQMAADDIVAANDTGAPPAAAADNAAPPVDAATPANGNGPPAGQARPVVNFGSAYYFVSFVGAPSATTPWMLQFGGHHLAINATVVGGQVTLSPTLTGGEPLKFTLDGRPVYIVEEEAVQAAALLATMTDEQKKKAIVSETRADLVLGPGHDGQTLQPEGIAGADLTDQQEAQFLKLIEARLGILNADDLAATMGPIAQNLDTTTFAWFGPTEPLGAAYWRVVGPTVILEFAPQANDGDVTDHAHNMYRDPTNEYGAAWTRLQ